MAASPSSKVIRGVVSLDLRAPPAATARENAAALIASAVKGEPLANVVNKPLA